MSLQESNEDIHAIMARAKAARERLRNLAPQPQRVVNVEAAPIVPRKTPLEDQFGFQWLAIRSVADVTGLSPKDIHHGPPTATIISARKLAMALAVRWTNASASHVAKLFGVNVDVVRDSVRVLDRSLHRLAISHHTWLKECIGAIHDAWAIAYKEADSRPTIGDLVRITCEEYRIQRADLVGPSRVAKLVEPRQLSMALCKRLTMHSLPEIGRRFGGRDHTTALHAVNKFAPLIEEANRNLPKDATTRDWVRAVRGNIGYVPFARVLRRGALA